MIVIIIQARMDSTRLPGKIMKKLAGRPMLWHVVQRCRQAKTVDLVTIATTVKSSDDLVEQWCQENQISYHRGLSGNVLERYYETAKKYGADTVVRVTSDDPLIDPAIIDLCVTEFKKSGYDYLSNVSRSGAPAERIFPEGLYAEVIKFSALEEAYLHAYQPYEEEHVTPYIWENKKGEFRIGPTVNPSPDYSRGYRLAVDYPEDFLLMEKIYQHFYRPDALINVPEVLLFLDQHPELVSINAHCIQKPVMSDLGRL